MRKIKIATISLNVNTDDLNYGAVLHTYAMQKYLNSLEMVSKSVVIDYIPKHLKKYNFTFPFLTSLKMGKLKDCLKNIIKWPGYHLRRNKFRKFIDKNISLTPNKYDYNSLKEAHLDYDVYICESDVIWAEYFCNNEYDDNFFLNFPAAHKGYRIAYAPSISTSTISEGKKQEFYENILNIDVISLREGISCEYVRSNFNVQAVHVVDPVFLLKERDYKCLIRKKIMKYPYVLLYLPVDYDKDIIKQAKIYAKNHHYKLLEFNSSFRISFDHKIKYNVGIEDFLSAICYSECVFTNSFHAICFSIIFQKDFFAFSRNYSMKVIDLLQSVGLEDRYCVNLNAQYVASKIDYAKVKNKLDIHIEESKNWLIDGLKRGQVRAN